jgi:hypothetical protein
MKKPTKRQTAWRWNLILAAASAPIHAAAVLFEAKIPGDLELRAKVGLPNRRTLGFTGCIPYDTVAA